MAKKTSSKNVNPEKGEKNSVVATPLETEKSPKKESNFSFFSESVAKILGYGVLVLLLFFVVAVRSKLLDIPFERDEGGFAYMAKAWLEGQPLYSTYYDFKPPALYWTYGAFMALFGKTVGGVHTGLMLCTLGTVVVLFFMMRQLFGNLAACVAAATYAITSITPNVFGFAAHATQLFVLPGLGGIWLLHNANKRNSSLLMLLAGLLFGWAFIIKQQAIHYMFFGGTYLVLNHFFGENFKPIALLKLLVPLIIGSVAPYLYVLLLMKMTGRMDEFWFYTFEWPRQFVSGNSLENSKGLIGIMFPIVIRNQSWLWILAGIGSIVTLLAPISNDMKRFSFLFALFMLFGIATGFAFYPHYFVMFLPVVGLFNGLLVHNIYTILEKRGMGFLSVLPLLVFGFAWMEIINAKNEYFTNPDLNGIIRETYGSNPFVESPVLGKFIKERTNPTTDKIVIFGSEPEMYFDAGLKGSSKHIFVYPLVDGNAYNPRLRKEFYSQIEANPPKIIVFVQNPYSWLSRDTTNEMYTWMAKYINDHQYRQVGVIDQQPTGTIYKWNEEAFNYKPSSQDAVFVLELPKKEEIIVPK